MRSLTATLTTASMPAIAPGSARTVLCIRHVWCLGYVWLYFLRNIFLNSTGTRGIADRNTAIEDHTQQERECASMSLGRVGPAGYVDFSRDSFSRLVPGWMVSAVVTHRYSAGLIHAANRLQSHTQCKTNLKEQAGSCRLPNSDLIKNIL